MTKYFYILFFTLFTLDLFPQGATSSDYEEIRRVYFGTPPFDIADIMNPSSGTNPPNCAGYSDYSIGNFDQFDGNNSNIEFYTGIVKNQTYSLEVETGFCGPTPNVALANRSIKVYIDFNANTVFEANELVYTAPFVNTNSPTFQTSITIPNTAVIGELTMRIVYNRVEAFSQFWENNLFPYATHSFQYGETEDYTLVLVSYVDSATSLPSNCYNSPEGQIEIFPSPTAPSSLEYSINGLAGPWQTDLVYDNLFPGVYDVRVRDAALSPSYIYVQYEVLVGSPDTVVVTPAIISDYNGEDISCNGLSNGEVSISASGGTGAYTYQYLSSANPGLIDVLSNPLTGLSADTYSFIATDSEGCSSISSDLTLTSPESVSIQNVIVTEEVSCNGSCDAILTIISAGGVEPYNYSVNGVDNGNNNVVSNVCFGVPLILFEDANNCSVTLNTFLPNPTEIVLSASVTSDYFSFAVSCHNSSDGTIEVSASGGTGGEYSFSLDGGLTFPYSSSNILEIANLSAGSYNIIARDSNLCESLPQILNLNAPSQLAADFINTSSPVSCNGFSDGEISVQALNGVAPYSYSIDAGANTQTSGVFDDLTASTYDVFITDNNNCQYQESYILDEPSELNINSIDVTSNFNGSQLSCFGASDGVISVSFSGGTEPYSYSLSPNPAILNLPASNLITNLSSGTQTLLAVDFNGCVSTPVDFEIVEPQQLQITSVNLISNVSCFGGSDGELIISASGGTSAYSYFVNSLYPSLNQEPFSVNNLSANNYNIVVSDANGCISQTVNQSITQPAQITPNLSVTNLGCDQGTYGAASVSPVGGEPNYSYLWSTGSTSNSIDQILAGSYSVIITDANSCQETLVFDVTEPVIDLVVSPILCYGDDDGQIQLTLLNPNPSSVYSIFWDDANAQTTATAVSLLAGEYTVTMVDQFGCELTATESIIQPDSLFVFVEHSQLCPDNPFASALVYVSGGLTPYSYDWSTNESTELISIGIPGSYSIQVTDYYGCQQNVDFTIDPISTVQLDFVVQEVSCKDNKDGSIEVIPSFGYAPYSFQWSNFTQDAINGGIGSGDYSITVTDNNDCSYFEEIEVLPNNESCITTYSAFSPNGDQNNDYWHIENIDLYPDALVEVFNRWGDRVFSTKKYINAWDGAWQGMIDNSPLPSATYYYVITLNNDEEPIVGTVTIVR